MLVFVSAGGCAKWVSTHAKKNNVGIFLIGIRSLSSNSGDRIGVHVRVVHMHNGCRSLHRSRCSVLVHGEQRERSVVRHELKRKQERKKNYKSFENEL